MSQDQDETGNSTTIPGGRATTEEVTEEVTKEVSKNVKRRRLA